MNGVVSLFTEIPRMSMQNIYDVGYPVLIANAMVAFMLNVSVVFLVRSFCLDVYRPANKLLDRKDLVARSDSLWCPQGYPPGRC